MALAVRAVAAARPPRAAHVALLTMALGAGFLGVKAIEYTEEYHEKLIPGWNFQVPDDDRSHRRRTKCLTRGRWRCSSSSTSS